MDVTQVNKSCLGSFKQNKTKQKSSADQNMESRCSRLSALAPLVWRTCKYLLSKFLSVSFFDGLVIYKWNYQVSSTDLCSSWNVNSPLHVFYPRFLANLFGLRYRTNISGIVVYCTWGVLRKEKSGWGIPTREHIRESSATGVDTGGSWPGQHILSTDTTLWYSLVLWGLFT
jgi:hypothetical protein